MTLILTEGLKMSLDALVNRDAEQARQIFHIAEEVISLVDGAIVRCP